MNYRIVWVQAQLKRIANVWDTLDPKERHTVSQALDKIDYQLQDQPLNVGESRSIATDRILVEPPFAIWYRVHERLRVVQIYFVHIYDL